MQPSKRNIGVFGCGNMGACIVSGLLKNGLSPNHIQVTRRSQDALDAFKSEYGVRTSQCNQEVGNWADVWILAVKPQQFIDIAVELASLKLQHRPLVISVMSGVSVKMITQKLKHNLAAVVRAMPNTPALLGVGVTGLWGSDSLCHADKEFVSELFEAVGETVWLNSEAQINAVTAISGSGPAYYYQFMAAIEEAACSLGLSTDVAKQLNRATANGVLEMIKRNPHDLSTLTERVTSKGGTTQAALSVFSKAKLKEIVHEAIHAAHARAIELGDN